MENTEILELVTACLEERRFAALRELLMEENPADLAELFEELRTESLPFVYRILPKETAAMTFASLSPERQKLLIDSFSDFELRQVLSELYTDDTADIIEEMPASVARRILAAAPPEMRREVNELLKYPEDSAGSIMTTEYVSLRQDMTVAQALDYIRSVAIDKETVYTAYVTEKDRRLIGIVTAKCLLLSPLESKIADIMEENVISAETTLDRESVARMFEKYGFIALPVTDKEERLVGIVTFDDAIEVISEETEEDFAKLAAITPSDDGRTYLQTSALRIFTQRIPWLMILMFSATVTGMIIASFESALAVSVVLTGFIPMLMGTGGNSASQASVTVIRGISLGELSFSDLPRVIYKELRVSLLCGVSLSVASFIKMLLIDRLLLGNPDVTVMVSLVVSLALLATVLCAKIIGGILPLLVGKLGLDPAVMANALIPTLIDALSLLIYFSVAVALLPI